MNLWTEHRNPEGRTYWFNTGTRESVWEKPDELKTPFERALNQTKWKEYFSGGRKYYYNTETKESKWDMPDELLLVLERVEKDGSVNQQALAAPGAAPPASSSSASGTAIQGALVPMGGTDLSSSASASQPNHLNGTDNAVGPHTGALPFTSTSILPARPNLPDDPVIPHNGFATFEEGEKAFMHLLRKAGVDANWTWDQTMRAIITDPLYKALNTLAEKKAAWQKFTDNLKAKEQEEKEARLAKLRPALRNMLKGNPNVFHYTTFATADKLFSQHPIWQQCKIEAERKLIFEEYVTELKQREVQETRAARSRSISKIVSLFKQLEVDVLTRWRTAHTLVLDSEEWKNDHELRKLPTLDILLAFEDYSRVREREFEEQTRRAQVEKTRRERKAREGFKELLENLVEAGKIKARTKWKGIYPLFSSDERYLSMLGNPGSNPLELFWDLVDNLDQKLDVKIAVVEEAILAHNTRVSANGGPSDGTKAFVVGPITTEEEFMTVVKEYLKDGDNTLGDGDLHSVFETLHLQAVKKQSDEIRRMERKQRHLQDDLRYALKKLPEPIDIDTSYEAAIPLIEHLPEFKAIEDDNGRRAAFSKFVKRQKERLREASEDGASTTSRKRKEPPRDHRDGDRERERSEKYREPERDNHRGKDFERDGRSKPTPRGHDEYDGPSHRAYPRERDRDRERDKNQSRERDRDKDSYRSSRHHRESEKDDKRRDRKSSRAEYGSISRGDGSGRKRDERERSTSVYGEEPPEKRKAMQEDGTDKRLAYERGEPLDEVENGDAHRAETPEEGEI